MLVNAGLGSMNNTVDAFRSVIEYCQIGGWIMALPILVVVLLHRRGMRFKAEERSAARTAVLWVVALSLFPVMLGTGSCVIGGLVTGHGICEFTPKGHKGPLDPVENFLQIQITYSIPFLLSAFLFSVSLLALLPGGGNGWKRFIFIVSFGRRGKWT